MNAKAIAYARNTEADTTAPANLPDASIVRMYSCTIALFASISSSKSRSGRMYAWLAEDSPHVVSSVPGGCHGMSAGQVAGEGSFCPAGRINFSPHSAELRHGLKLSDYSEVFNYLQILVRRNPLCSKKVTMFFEYGLRQTRVLEFVRDWV